MAVDKMGGNNYALYTKMIYNKHHITSNKKCRGSNVIEKHSTMQVLKELSQNKDEEMSDLCMIKIQRFLNLDPV